MATAGERWAVWLETQLEDKEWRPRDLVKASGVKPNGRPVIDAPRVSAWLKGERPSYELAVIAGAALGALERDALIAAGYPVGLDVVVPTAGLVLEVKQAPHQPEPLRVVSDETNPVIAAIEADPYLLPEAKAHFLNQYGLLRRIGQEATNEGLAYVARGEATEPLDPAREAELAKHAAEVAAENRKAPRPKSKRTP